MVASSTKSVMNAPVLRRLKKSSSTVGTIPTFKVVVFGQSGVGKTAMSVRFVTKRFIGEYDPTLENIYQHYYGVGGATVLFEIMDTAGQEENDLMMEEKMRWADAFLLVYAINDQTSFEEIPRLKFTISHTMSQLSQQHKQVHPDPVIMIVGNKTDLEPDRMVEREEGEGLARSMKCGFKEISVRDGVNQVFEVFEEIHELYKHRQTVHLSSNESNGTISRRKTKSFKYVDRIPRMQGKRCNVSPFHDLNNRYRHNSELSSGIMTSKIDEDSEMADHGRNGLTRSFSRSYTRSTLSLPSEVSNENSSEGGEVRPTLRRRNAVIGLGGPANPLTMNDQSSDEDKQHFFGQRRQKLRPRFSDNTVPEGFEEVKQLKSCDSNNNNNMKKTNRRCRSQESIGLNQHSMLENLTKNAVSFDVSTGMSRRVS